MPPKTRYATGDGGVVAYQVLGEGPDLVYIPNWISNIEIMWEEPAYARFLERLASFTRLICLDKRGSGLSDAVPFAALPTLEQWMDDILLVLDAVGSRRSAMLGCDIGGPLSILFAASYPERTTHLILADTWAWLKRQQDYPIGIPSDILHAFALLPETSYEWDLRPVLPSVRVPTLVMHHQSRTYVRPDHGRYLAAHIDRARYVDLPGSDVLIFREDADTIVNEIREFLTGVREAIETDRILATVLFTDIVGSTDRAAEVGDRRWRELLDAHDAIVRTRITEFRGREVKTTGDGVLASFDGPARAIRCAAAITRDVRGLGIEIKAGLHTGEVEVRGEDIGGIAVHTAARVVGAAAPGEVLVSRTVKDLVAGSGLEFDDRGTHELKGVPGEWRLFAVKG